MAIKWGSGSGSSNPHYVGIDASVSGTTITWKVYTKATYPVSDNQVLKLSGAVSRTVDYRQEGPAQKLRATSSSSGSRGSSYTLTAKVSGVYNGGAPSVSRTVKIPALKPSKCGTPTVSSTSQTSAALRLASAPSSNGAAINAYQWEVSGGPKSGTLTSNGRSWTASGLKGNTSYQARVRARNSVGWGAWSNWRSFKTSPLPPNKPGTPSISDIKTTSFKATLGSAPANNGASVTSYGWQVENLDTGGTATATTTGRTWTRTGNGANARYRVRVRARNSAGWSAYSNWVNFQMGANAPAAPTGVSSARSSDSIIVTSWTVASTSAAPVEGHEVRRRDNVETSWVTVANLSGTTSSYQDRTVRDDRRYEYQVRSTNRGGSSAYSVGPVVETTPAAPSGLRVVRQGDFAVLTWTNNSSYPTAVEVGRSVDGVWAASTVHTVAAGGEARWVDTSVSRGDWLRYRVRSRSSSPVLRSAWVESAELSGSAPPNKPVFNGPRGVHDATKPIVLEFDHNPADGSDLTKFQLRVSKNGAAFTTLAAVTSDVARYSYSAPGEPCEMRFQVRTWGGHADASDWSDVFTVDCAIVPVVTITSPLVGEVWQRATVAVSWSVQVPEAVQARWEAELHCDGEAVEQQSGAGDSTRSVSFRTRLDMESTWLIRVRAVASSGLQSAWRQVLLNVNFPKPAPPVISTEWNAKRGTASVQIMNPPDPDPKEHRFTNFALSAGCRGDDVPWWAREGRDWGSAEPVSAQRATDPQVPISDGSPELGAVDVATEGRVPLLVSPHVASNFAQVAQGSVGFGALVQVSGAAYRSDSEGEYLRAGWLIRTSGGVSHEWSEWQEVEPDDWVWLAAPVMSKGAAVELVPLIEVEGEGDPENPDDDPVEGGEAEGRLVRVTAALVRDLVTSGLSIDDWFDAALPDVDRPELFREMTWLDEAGSPLEFGASRRFEITNPTARPPAVENILRRSVDSGPWMEIAADLPINSTYVDRDAPAAGDVRYEAVAVSDLPSTERSNRVTLMVPAKGHSEHSGCGVWVSGGPGWGDVCRAYYEFRLAGGTQAAFRKLERFDGRELPVEFSAPGVDRTWELSWLEPPEWDLDSRSQTVEEWDALTVLPGPHLLRDCTGRRRYVSVGPFSYMRREDNWWLCSLSLTEVGRV